MSDNVYIEMPDNINLQLYEKQKRLNEELNGCICILTIIIIYLSYSYYYC